MTVCEDFPQKHAPPELALLIKEANGGEPDAVVNAWIRPSQQSLSEESL
jgi:hypothetical protein